MRERYVDNVCKMLRRKGLASKYESPGIYCIKLNERVVYIGKSQNMLERVAQHFVGVRRGSERKYRILAEAQRKGQTVGFDVLYYAKSKTKKDILNEIGEKEGEFIRAYRPILNTQIPKEENWHKWNVEEVNAREVLKLLLDE